MQTEEGFIEFTKEINSDKFDKLTSSVEQFDYVWGNVESAGYELDPETNEIKKSFTVKLRVYF